VSLVNAILRIVLPLFIVGAVVLTILWPQLQPQPDDLKTVREAVPADETLDPTIAHPRYSGTDAQGRPYSLVASEARQPREADKQLHLTDPVGQLATTDGNTVVLTAVDGVVDRSANTVDLEGDVELKDDKGFSLNTHSATIELQAGRAEGQKPVVGRGTFGEIRAEGFRFEDEGKVVHFLGKSQLSLQSGSGEGGQ